MYLQNSTYIKQKYINQTFFYITKGHLVCLKLEIKTI